MHEDRKAGERAERVLRRLGVSRKEAAQEIGVSLSLIAMMAGGNVRTRRVVALALQAQFGIRADYVLSGERPIFLRSPGTESLDDEALAVARSYERLRSARHRRAFRAVLLGLGALETGARRGSRKFPA
jgi:transcriptional regulator with XRE-family HTH domain